MITAELTTRKIKSLKVEIIRKNDYLDTPRYDVRALDGEPFTDRNAEGQYIPTAYATVLRSQLDNIKRTGVVNQHPADIAAALDAAKAEMFESRMERFEQVFQILDKFNFDADSNFYERIDAGWLSRNVLANQIAAHL